jgi:hypothetical protein
LQSQLQQEKENLDPETRKLLEIKIEGLGHQATLRAMGALQLTRMPPMDKAARETMMHPQITIHVQQSTGIMENSPFVDPDRKYTIQNSWKENVSGKDMLVFAGYLNKNTPQSVIIVYLDNRFQGEYLVPVPKVGSRILEARGDQLILTSNPGEQLAFNLTTRTFSYTKDGVVITTTPIPARVAPQTTPIPAYPYP